MKICNSCQSSYGGFDWHCPHCHFSPAMKNGFRTLAPDFCRSDTGFDRGEFERLAEVEEKSFWFRSRNRLIVSTIQKLFPKAESFFEVGCGTGFVLSEVGRRIRALSIYGSELSVEGLPFAAKRAPEANLFQMDALNMPFKAEFDLIGMFDVLEHIESDRQVLQQVHKSLKPGGAIIITVPQHMFLWSYRDQLAGHFRRYSRSELKEKLEKAGFKCLFATGFVSFLLPAMFASRIFKTSGSNEQAAKELTAPGPANFILETVLQLERGLIKLGLSFPFGGSLLMVAERL